MQIYVAETSKSCVAEENFIKSILYSLSIVDQGLRV